MYSHKINVHPGYPVRDLLVDVTIHETRDINVLEVKKVPGGPDFRDAGKYYNVEDTRNNNVTL